MLKKKQENDMYLFINRKKEKLHILCYMIIHNYTTETS
jgi:hypothetical protein